MSPCVLQTDRICLHPFHPNDAASFYEMNLDPEVMRYTGDVPFVDVAAAEDFIRGYDPYSRWGYGRWTMRLRTDDTYLGFCGLKYHPERGETDIGFRLPQPFWGQGYATEAGQACVDYAFGPLGLTRLIGQVHPENRASKRVLYKLGLRYESIEVHEGEDWEVWGMTR